VSASTIANPAAWCRVPDRAAVARAAWWTALVLNLAVVIGDLVGQEFGLAGGQSLFVVALLAWRVYAPYVDRQFEARLAATRAEQQLAERVREVITRDAAARGLVQARPPLRNAALN
jgi:hypothetical protein